MKLAIRRTDPLLERNLDSVILLINMVRHESAKRKYIFGLFKADYITGLVMIKKGDHSKAIQVLQHALTYRDSIGFEHSQLPAIYNNIAIAYIYMGKFDSATTYLYQALDTLMIQEKPTPMLLATVYNNLSSVWLEIDSSSTQALQYMEQGEKWARSKHDTMSIVLALFNKGNFYQDHKKYDSASHYYQQAHTLNKYAHGVLSMEIMILDELGRLHIRTGDYMAARNVLERSLEKSRQTGNSPHFISGSFLLGEAFYKQKNYRKAIETILPALKEANNTDYELEASNAHHIMAEAYAATGNSDSAYKHQVAYIALREKMLEKEKLKALNKLEMKYRLGEKDKEITIKETRIQNKNILIVSILACSLLGILVFILINRGKNQKQRLQEQQLKTMGQQMEINKLKDTIEGEEKERSRLAKELHDGIGGLISGAGMNLNMLKKEYHDINEKPAYQDSVRLIKQASSELRKTAHNLTPDFLTVQGLAAAVSDYCGGIENSNNFSIDFMVIGDPVELKKETELSAYRIIQELLHNIVKHAQATEVIVQLTYRERSFSLLVEDDGVGMNSENGKMTGIGLQNIAGRVAALNGVLEISGSNGIGCSVYAEFEMEDNTHSENNDKSIYNR